MIKNNDVLKSPVCTPRKKKSQEEEENGSHEGFARQILIDHLRHLGRSGLSSPGFRRRYYVYLHIVL